MRISGDEARALGFVALLLSLAGAARVLDRTPPLIPPAEALDLTALEQASREALAADRRRRTPLAPGERIDPNTAEPDEIARLPGIGRVTAERVVAHRDARGAFRTADELARVPGIGPATVDRIAPHLALPRGEPASGPGPERPAPAAPAPRVAGTSLLDLNRASAAELQALPGIGPVIAARIVAFRDSVGPFRTVDELVRVPGIGPATLARLAPRIHVRP